MPSSGLLTPQAAGGNLDWFPVVPLEQLPALFESVEAQWTRYLAGLTDQDLSLNYTSSCDPRLNNKQALEAAFLIAGYYRDGSMEPGA